MATLVGIDLGGISSPRTAVAVWANGRFTLYSADSIHSRFSGEPDPDRSFFDWICTLKPDVVGLDAPMGLPVLTSPNYYKRAADKELGGDSPFRLGLPRAYYLRHLFESIHPVIRVIEIYPKTVLELFPEIHSRGYKQSSSEALQLRKQIVSVLLKHYDNLGCKITDEERSDIASSDHSLDAFLALIAVGHYHQGDGYHKAHLNEAHPNGTSPGFLRPDPPFIKPLMGTGSASKVIFST